MTEEQFEEAIALPATVWGYFEWLTGVIRINIAGDTFNEKLLTKTEQNGLDETYYHEIFHCCQICTTGFLYYHVAHFLQGIAPVWRKLTEGALGHGFTIPELVGDVIRNMPQIPDFMLQLYSAIDEPDPHFQITARKLIEGQAYFVQKLLMADKITHADFLQMLFDAPSRTYSSAYERASEILEEYTFDLFNAICFESLCFLKPQLVFMPMCELTKAGIKQKLNPAVAVQAAKMELRKMNYYLGTSFDVTPKFIKNQQLNPFYRANMSILAAFGKKKKMSLNVMMANPCTWYKEVVATLDLLIILNSSEVYQHSKAKEWKVFDKNVNKNLRIVLSAITLVVNNTSNINSPEYLHLRKR